MTRAPDPSRVPPAILNGTPRQTNRAVPLEQAHGLLGIAWAAFDRARANPPAGPILCAPACAERIGVLAGAGDERGVARFMDMAVRLDTLTDGTRQ